MTDSKMLKKLREASYEKAKCNHENGFIYHLSCQSKEGQYLAIYKMHSYGPFMAKDAAKKKLEELRKENGM